jgi:hypothetical protein
LGKTAQNRENRNGAQMSFFPGVWAIRKAMQNCANGDFAISSQARGKRNVLRKVWRSAKSPQDSVLDIPLVCGIIGQQTIP